MWKRRARELLNGPRPAILGPLTDPLSPSPAAECRRSSAATAGLPRGRGTTHLGRNDATWRPYCTGSSSRGKCWQCGAEARGGAFLVCGACRSVQPLDPSLDFFHIFELEREYNLSVEELERKYKEWQKKLHPDLVHTKSERERCYAADQSARVITAFSTLSKPLSRAIYMLQVEGLNVEEEGTISDPDLLSEVMEIREAVEEAEDPRSLNQIKSTSEEKMKIWSTLFGEAFKSRRFDEAVTAMRRMTYYQRAIEEIIKKL